MEIRQYITKAEFREMHDWLKEEVEHMERNAEGTPGRSYERCEANGARHIISLIDAYVVGLYNGKGIDI